MKKLIGFLLTVILLFTMLFSFMITANAEEQDYLCLTSTGYTKIAFANFPSSTEYKLEYYVNDGEWEQADINTVINLKDNDSVRFKANGEEGMFSSTKYLTFKLSGNGTVAASGNVMSLLSNDKCCNYCFKGLFRSCTLLTAAPKLPATTLADYCYESMFSYCKALTTAPQLPATTLVYNCYQQMFLNCTSLKITSEKPENGHYSEIYIPDTFHCSSMFAKIPDAPTIESGKTYYSPYGVSTTTKTVTVTRETTICDGCGEVLSVSDVNTDTPASGFTLSNGSLAIITAVAGVAVGFLVAMFIFKKKKPETEK